MSTKPKKILDFNIGELIIFGFKGFEVSPETQKTIIDYGIGNTILFGTAHKNNNYDSKEQLIQLTDQLQEIHAMGGSNLPMIISADQEGGLVQRFRKGFTELPSAKAVSEYVFQKKSTLPALELAKIQAKELYSGGIQLNFAPVCDINTNPANPVIGTRAYGSTEASVSNVVTEIIRGHLSENVQPCIKHFPGHGDTHVDSHLELPIVTTSLEVLRTREWLPFQKSIRAGCNFLMSAHLMLSHLDPNFPGTLSQTFLKKYLREELNFQGVVVSDDMEMKAISSNYGMGEAPILALQAGCDLLCYQTEETAIFAMNSIEKAVIDQRLSAEQLKASVERVRKIRRNIKLAKDALSKVKRLEIIGNPEHLQFAAQFI